MISCSRFKYVFCRSLFVLFFFFSFFFVIVLSVLQFTDSDYPFGIFKLFLRSFMNCIYFFMKMWFLFVRHTNLLTDIYPARVLFEQENCTNWIIFCYILSLTEIFSFIWYPCHMLPVELWEPSCKSSSLSVDRNIPQKRQ
jgi:hypothetical protein